MKNKINNNKNIIQNENGIVLIIALIMLCMMTIIGTAVSNTSKTETMISGAEKEQREAFYVAEAGVDHAKGLLESLFISRNAVKMAAGKSPDWDFALDGSEPGILAAGLNADGNPDFENGAIWITKGTMGGNYTYSVTVWDDKDTANDGGPDATDDGDGIIYIRSVANGPHGDSVAVEVSVMGTASGVGSINDYGAQAGAGSGKNYSSTDTEAISNFTEQM